MKFDIVIVIVILLVVGWLFLQHKLKSQELMLAQYATQLENTQSDLESLRSVMATQESVRKLRDEMSLVLATGTVLIESQTQVNINSINELKEQLKDESKQVGRDVNVLSRHTIEWLQRYEQGRKN